MTANMVLRFRDLISDTIYEHKKYIDKYGFVWWGWWSKPEEKIPLLEFSQFQNTIKDKGFMWIYLADSGKYRLYKAKLTEMDISEDEEPKECQDIERVPEYYYIARNKAWFRFDKIIDISTNDIREWSFDKSCSLTFESRDKKYHNKQIDNLKELIEHCHRTIYFIQPYNSNGGDEVTSENELKSYVHQIFETIEAINSRCHRSSIRGESPVFIPRYPKKTEKALMSPAKNELLLSNFSSELYKLIVDGHKMVNEDKSIIPKYEILKVIDNLLAAIRIFRHYYHHSDKRNTSSERNMGELNYKLTGKSVLDDSASKIKFQLKLLIWTLTVLKNEYDLVTNAISSHENRN